MIKLAPKTFALAESGEINDLKKALQHAIELEHSTMPPYLYAMYSLKDSASIYNKHIATVIREIVMEEMLHMLLAANILKAIGGSPVIYSPSFVPDYPTHLPGTVAGDLVVPLKPFSRELAETVFMQIEEPENVLDFPVVSFETTAEPPRTIGEFYKRIRKIFEDRGDAIIADKTGEGQPTLPGDFRENMRITSAQQAMQAIDVIVEQGEGTTTEPFFPDNDERPDNNRLAHYYRFAELVKGKIIRNPDATSLTPADKRYLYNSADPVPFDASQVLKFPDNPKSRQYRKGSAARKASDEFNRAYTKILRFLHQAFNTNPTRMEDAIGLMMWELSEAAGKLMRIRLTNGQTPGPTFEFLE